MLQSHLGRVEYHARDALIPLPLGLDLYMFLFEDYFVHFFTLQHFPLQKQYMFVI